MYMEKIENYERKIVTTIIIGVIVLLLGVLLLCLSIDFKKKITLPYKDNGSIDYSVYLKDNEFYEEKSLPKGKKYISALIDNIDTKFDYKFSVEKNINMKYNYYIDGTIIVKDTDGKSIYEKKYTLVENKTKEEYGNIFSINENLKINYDKYNLVAKKFLSQYNVSKDVEFVVKLHVNVIGTHEDFNNNLSDNGVLELSIPLKNTLSTIEIGEYISNKNDTLLQYSETRINNYMMFTIAIALIVLDLIIVGYVLIGIIRNRDASTLYNLQLNKIKKEYDRYISETVITQKLDDLLKTRSLRIILIKTFDDLLDIRDSLKSPILFHEEIPGVETVFYIINDNVAYLYLMHVNKFKRKNKDNEEIEILIA